MELRTLHYFLMVAREENITRASEQLHMTQPALSRQLMQLEDEIGTQLLIRGKRKIQLTEAGMLLRRRAEEILDLVDKTERELNHHEDLIGEITIGTADCLATHCFLPELIQSFSKAYPQVSYHFHIGTADLMKERLDQGLIDIAILLEPVDITKYDFVRLPQKERWGLLVHSQSSLAQKEYVVPQDLLDIPLFNTRRSIVQNEIASWFKDDYQKLNFIATHDLLPNIISLVEKGFGNVITIEGAFYHYSTEYVKFIPFSPALITGSVFVWKKHQTLSPVVQSFIECIYHAIET